MANLFLQFGDKTKPSKEENTTNSQSAELRNSKLAILFGKNQKEAN